MPGCPFSLTHHRLIRFVNPVKAIRPVARRLPCIVQIFRDNSRKPTRSRVEPSMFGQPPDSTKLRILAGSLWAGRSSEPLPPVGIPECPTYLDETAKEI